MSEITEQEAREAVERISKAIDDEASGVADGDTAMQIYGTSDIELAVECGKRDLRKVVEFARQELARPDAERAERLLPITVEWLESIGFTRYAKQDSQGNALLMLEAIYGGGYLSWSGHDGFRLCELHLGFTTRGQVLDLLAALKGGAE